jgi:hypothetical protein
MTLAKPHRTPSVRFALTFALLAGIACALFDLSDSENTPLAVAAPHTVRAVDHPFDQDWLDVSLVLAAKCAGCHFAGSELPDLSSYEALIDAKDEDGEPIITPGKPDESWLWEQVVWNHDANPDSEDADEPLMPSNDEGEWLTAGQLATLRQWIEQGALEYRLPETCSTRPLLETDFPSAKECRICHPKQYTEWSRSMHAYAQHSPVYMAYNLTLQERTGGTMGTFCTRCHTPIGTSLGENGLRRNVHRSRLSMEGLTCVVCHRVAQPYYKSDTRRAIVPGKLIDTCMYGPFVDPVSDDLKAHPAANSEYLKSAAFCGACHDFVSPQGIRLEEGYSEWVNSPAAKKGIRCQHCHMGPIPGVPTLDHERPMGRIATIPGVDPKLIPLRPLSNHTFAGPDYSMLPDTEFPHKLDWMYEVDYRDTEKLTPHQKKTLKALRRKNRRQLRIADNMRYQLLKNAAEISVQAPEFATAGSRIKVRVDVINKIMAHNFMTGLTEERQAWVEVTLRDPNGLPVFQSGNLDSNNDLRDDHSHLVKAGKIAHDKHLLHFQSRFIAQTFKGTERPVVISVNRDLAPINVIRPSNFVPASFGRPPIFRVAKASIPPLSSDGKNYRMRLPDCPGDYWLDVKLNFRNLPPHLLDKIGVPHLKRLLEIVVIDQYQSIIHVTPEKKKLRFR